MRPLDRVWFWMLLRMPSPWTCRSGIAVGVLGALGLSRWLRTLVYEVEVAAPRVYALVSVGMVAVATLARWIPARRAGAVDPMRAFRAE